MPNSLVSVVMATFNGDKFLREQIESILSQSYSPIELIVFDDCSTDRSFEILEEYQNRGLLSAYRNPSNLGYVKNFEKAIQKANGEYIALADQDDVWFPSKIEILVQEIGSNLLIHSDASLINELGDEIASSFEDFASKMTVPDSFSEAVLNGAVTGCTCLFKKELLETALPFPDGLYIHDKWLGVLAFHQGGIKYIKKPLIAYRQHYQNSIGANQTSTSLWDRILRFLKRGKVNYQYEAFRSYLQKERLFVFQVQKRLKLESLEVNRIRDFFDWVLEGKGLFPVVVFYLRNFGAIEKNKSISQKIYFFYLVLLSFFYSRKVKNEIP